MQKRAPEKEADAVYRHLVQLSKANPAHLKEIHLLAIAIHMEALFVLLLSSTIPSQIYQDFFLSTTDIHINTKSLDNSGSRLPGPIILLS